MQTSIDSIPNPALDGSDIVRLNHAGRLERSIVQALTIPLKADGDFSITLRGAKEDATP